MEKITITPLTAKGDPDDSKAITVLFNPATYSVAKSVSWSPVGGGALDAPALNFGGGAARTLSLELFYDVTESVTIGGAIKSLQDVREQTNRMVALTRIDKDLKQPPVIEISWGDSGPKDSDFPFQGVITSLNQNFTLFSDDGTPLRATLSVSLMEFRKKESAVRTDFASSLTKVVKTGDRLDTLAGDHAGGAANWRDLADANNLDNPRDLPVGKPITIPGR